MSKTISPTDALIVAGIADGRNKGISVADVHDVVHTHDQMGSLNYIWLAPWLGSQPLWIEFREPPGPKGQWQHYNRFWWARHGCVISHDPSNLVEDHVKAIVNPKTRFLELRFYFETPSGFQYSASPTREFYELEKQFFERHGLCSGGWSKQKLRKLAKTIENEPGLAPHWGPEILRRNLLMPPLEQKPKEKEKRKPKSGKKRSAGSSRFPVGSTRTSQNVDNRPRERRISMADRTFPMANRVK